MNNSTNFQLKNIPDGQIYQPQQQQNVYSNQTFSHGQNYNRTPVYPHSFPPPPQFQHSGQNTFSSPYVNSAAIIPNFSVPPPPFQPVYDYQTQNREFLPSTNSSFHISPFNHVTSNVRKERSQREIDTDWISNWSRDIGRQKSASLDHKRTLSISEVRSVLLSFVLVLKELRTMKEQLCEMTDVDDDEWRRKLQQVRSLKDKLAGLRESLDSLDCLKRKLRKRKLKRSREKAKRREEIAEREMRTAERRELHRVVDAQRNAVRKKVLEDKRKREMQTEADTILAEVKRKIHDAKRARECARVLEKLRHIRKENSQKKGLHVSTESDKAFQNGIVSVKQLLHEQMGIYQSEEKALRVMLESEREEQRELENTKKREAILKLLDQRETEISEDLFGENNLDQCHPLYFYWQYYTQAERSLESLIQIRYLWDTFAIENGNETSCIPVRWVVPSKPSSDLWATMLQ